MRLSLFTHLVKFNTICIIIKQCMPTYFFRSSRGAQRYMGFIFLIVLYGCWLAGHANSYHVSDHVDKVKCANGWPFRGYWILFAGKLYFDSWSAFPRSYHGPQDRTHRPHTLWLRRCRFHNHKQVYGIFFCWHWACDLCITHSVRNFKKNLLLRPDAVLLLCRT